MRLSLLYKVLITYLKHVLIFSYVSTFQLIQCLIIATDYVPTTLTISYLLLTLRSETPKKRKFDGPMKNTRKSKKQYPLNSSDVVAPNLSELLFICLISSSNSMFSLIANLYNADVSSLKFLFYRRGKLNISVYNVY